MTSQNSHWRFLLLINHNHIKGGMRGATIATTVHSRKKPDDEN